MTKAKAAKLGMPKNMYLPYKKMILGAMELVKEKK